MVHGLQTLKRMNDEAAKKARHGQAVVPAAVHRGVENRRWTTAELNESGTKNPYRAYAASSSACDRIRRDLEGKELAETIRT